jgi:hypothetical protein
MSDDKETSIWWHILSHPKMLLMIVAGPALVYIGARNLAATLFEKSPTRIQAERFAEDFRGQRWLHVEGRLLPEYAWWHESNNGFVNVDVPLVPLDWKKDQPLHIVRSFSIHGSELAAWKDKTARSPQYSLTGLTGPLGPMRYWDMFPTLKFEEPVVYINDGQSPDSPGIGIFLLAIGGFFLIVSWKWLFLLIALWWRQRRAAAAAREEAEWAQWH